MANQVDHTVVSVESFLKGALCSVVASVVLEEKDL